MAKLNKTQIQALVNKMHSKVQETLATEKAAKIAEFKTTNQAKEYEKLLKKAHKLEKQLEETQEALVAMSSKGSLDYNWRNPNRINTIINTWAAQEIEKDLTKYDLSQVENDLILGTIDSDFDIDAFIANIDAYRK